MAPKHHPTPLSGGDRKALAKELGKARAMTTILATRSVEARSKGEALIRTADTLLCESWNERMWRTVSRSTHRLRSTKPSMAATAGSKSNARAASRVEASILRPYPTHRRLSFMTWPADFAAANAARPTGGLLRRCFNSHGAPPKCRRPKSCHLYPIAGKQAAIIALFRVMNLHVRSAASALALPERRALRSPRAYRGAG
jgi:hypothetical protein